MKKINRQKNLLSFRKKKVKQILKIIDETTNRSQLIFEFCLHFADLSEESDELKQKKIILLITAFRKLDI